MIDLGPDTETTEAIRQLADMHRRAVSAESELAALRARVAELSEQRAQALELANSLASESDTMRMLHDIATATSPNIKTASTNLAVAVCDILLAWLEAYGAENYIELTMADSEKSTGLTFTVRRNDRPTPQTLRAKAESERDAALARVAELESEVRNLAFERGDANEARMDAEARLAALEAPPVVPRGMKVAKTRAGEWIYNGDCKNAALLKAYVWAVEYDTRPPHKEDSK